MDKFTSLLDQLAHVVGARGVRLWPQVVQVYWLQTILDLLFYPPVLVAGVWMTYTFAHKASATDEDGEITVWTVLSIVVGIATFFLLIVYVINFSAMVSAVLYPEASYVKQHLEKGLK